MIRKSSDLKFCHRDPYKSQVQRYMYRNMHSFGRISNSKQWLETSTTDHETQLARQRNHVHRGPPQNVRINVLLQQSPGQVMAGRGDVGPGSSDGRAPDM